MSQPNWFRTCVGCGNARHKQELLRIVKRQDNRLEIDIDQNKPGRGAYICPKIECVKLAETRNGLDRSLCVEVAKEFYNILFDQVIKIER